MRIAIGSRRASVHLGLLAGVALAVALAAQALDPSRAYVLVQLRPSGAAAARAAGATVVSRRLSIWRVSPARATALGRAGLVELSEPDRRLAAAGAAAGPASSEGWWLTAVGADPARAPGPGKPVTVIDTGIDVTQPVFAERPTTTLLDPQTTSGREEGHGTMVGSVVVGVYPQVSLRSWDATPEPGDFSTASAIAGLEAAAAEGPGVVNMSFGDFDRDPLLEQAIAVAVRSGLVLVAAAGNDRGSGSRDAYPASLPHVLTVGAVDAGGRVTGFSSAQPGIDLVAPGDAIPVSTPGGEAATADGTSFAAPIAAAAAAWVWTARPRLDASQVSELLRRSARDLGRRGYDADSGFGLLDLRRALVLQAPRSDPGEPNEDVSLVAAGGVFSAATAPLRQGSLHARLDFSEDPQDVYPVELPARTAVTVALRPAAPVALELWRSTTRSVDEAGAARARDLIAVAPRRGATRSFTVANAGDHPVLVYADVYPEQGVRAAEYDLTVSRVTTTSTRRSRSRAPGAARAG